ncbi:sister chromatid cohesion 1 protein 2 isoform X2 [Cajanus cajan]|uniref:sister chromatid cohesion 1 protein 2 isoform X2 n=1 Tax=Cajanus cajan TaxID=3821 RepID=UPI00098D841D|nr:sister chromatid cohesion 1 protein 2 isoform X2 [Cajanus cajan]
MLRAKLVRSGNDTLRIAAFFFKNLKRAQILHTDISSTVDKILQDEVNVVSYGVLGYLLLGVVRIYSKKVEYVLHDCEVLIKINKFVINTEDITHVETLRMSITIPDKLELDAFELDIPEDAVGDHIAAPEEITLKEVVSRTEGFGLLSHEKFEEFDFGESTCTFDHHIVENVRLSQMLMEIEVFPQKSPIGLLESRDTCQSSIFSPNEVTNFDNSSLIAGVEKESANLLGQNQQIIEDRSIKHIVPCEDEIQEESSRISQEGPMDNNMFSMREKEHVLFVEAFNESHQVDIDQNSNKETSSSLCKMNQEIIGVHEARCLQESIEKPQNEKSYEKECVRHGNSFVDKEIPEEHIEGSVEKHDNKGKLVFQEQVSLEDERLSVISPKSINLDATPQSKFNVDSVGRPKRGATLSDSMLISTPAVRERPHFSRKRKVVLYNKRVVLSNEVLKENIRDASSLVSDRRKSHRTVHTVLRESLIASLPNRFYEPLHPCSSNLQLLFSKKEMKIPDSLRIMETLGNLDVSESQTVGSPQPIANILPTPCHHCPDISESQASGSPEHIAASSPHENIETEQSLERNEVFNLMDEVGGLVVPGEISVGFWIVKGSNIVYKSGLSS